jgi:AcrR family transcriptional regulator
VTQSQSVPKTSRAGTTTTDAAEHPSRGGRKEAILEAGVAIFGSVPYDEVSVDDIASRAGVAHGLVFHYFRNKRGLYLSVLQRTAGDLQQAQAPPGAQWSPSRRVRAIGARDAIRGSCSPPHEPS